MKLLKKHWTEIVSIASIVVAIISFVCNYNLQEKYNILSTYGMTLNYQVEISDKTGEGNIILNNTETNNNIIQKGQIDIIPKMGGIEKVYAIHYYKNNVKAIAPVELYPKGIGSFDSQKVFWRLSKYTLDIIADTSDVYFATLYLVVKDFQNNYYTNMIVYEIEKEDMSNINTRIYSNIDLLYAYNEDINVLPKFDIDQMKEYQNLIDKIDDILHN